jgi:hypothetical protein
MSEVVHCECCRCRITGPREALRRCALCDLCDGFHGDRLQIRVMVLMASRQITPGHALARMLFDDAHHAGMLELHPDPQPGQPMAHRVWIPSAVPRWRVVIGRAVARGEPPDLGLIMQVIVARYQPARPTPDLLTTIALELGSALKMLNPYVSEVQIGSTNDTELAPEHLIVNYVARDPDPPSEVVNLVAAEIPDDIMSRPRGSA